MHAHSEGLPKKDFQLAFLWVKGFLQPWLSDKIWLYFWKLLLIKSKRVMSHILHPLNLLLVSFSASLHCVELSTWYISTSHPLQHCHPAFFLLLKPNTYSSHSYCHAHKWLRDNICAKSCGDQMSMSIRGQWTQQTPVRRWKCHKNVHSQIEGMQARTEPSKNHTSKADTWHWRSHFNLR